MGGAACLNCKLYVSFKQSHPSYSSRSGQGSRQCWERWRKEKEQSSWRRRVQSRGRSPLSFDLLWFLFFPKCLITIHDSSCRRIIPDLNTTYCHVITSFCWYSTIQYKPSFGVISDLLIFYTLWTSALSTAMQHLLCKETLLERLSLKLIPGLVSFHTTCDFVKQNFI